MKLTVSTNGNNVTTYEPDAELRRLLLELTNALRSTRSWARQDMIPTRPLKETPGA